VIETHRPEVHHEVHARAHRARTADAQQHHLAVGSGGGHRLLKCCRIVHIAARMQVAFGRPVDMEGVRKVGAADLCTLAVEHGHRMV